MNLYDIGSNRTNVGLKPGSASTGAGPPSPLKSDQCGIETWRCSECGLHYYSSNRTNVGLKQRWAKVGEVVVSGSNRTNVGLKPAGYLHLHDHPLRSNRTNVGLKPSRSKKGRGRCFSLKSDQCGIETDSLPRRVFDYEGSNRTNVGLKL